ncbi:hypothetical protein NET02_13120 [Thermomicrobiaceae bacterium CFH 74404]|uniref:Uncharacterized protein n=1 Tax=Thermalbibacter longus TaxID=2951981 RepID=A0AA42BBQ6_9BACT|nr:hypothetical protein [Thermalbibacter longus]MCM8750089.1 hypothetical protein [Thermalbibacter longus]
MQRLMSHLIGTVDEHSLGTALATVKQGVAELALPRPDPQLLDAADQALQQIVEAGGLTNALQLAEMIQMVESAIDLVRGSEGRVLLAPYVQALVLDLERAVASFVTGSPVAPMLEHARGLSQLIERWQPDRLIALDSYEQSVTTGALEAHRGSPVLKITGRLSAGAGTSHAASGWLSGNGSGRDGSKESPVNHQPNLQATIGEILSTADMLLTALAAMPSRLELLDALHVCAHSILDMVDGHPGPLPRLAAAAADLLTDCRNRLVPPDDQAREYLRTLWLMSSLLLVTTDPPRALLAAIESLLAEPPQPPTVASNI